MRKSTMWRQGCVDRRRKDEKEERRKMMKVP